VAEKDEEGVEDHEDDAEGAEPESILRHFPRREPPSAAELRELKSKLRGSYDAYARLVSLEIGQHAIGPESRRHLHQDMLTRFWARVKQQGPRGGDVKPGAGRRKPRLEHRPSRARTRHAWPVNDTSPAADARYHQLLRAMPPSAGWRPPWA